MLTRHAPRRASFLLLALAGASCTDTGLQPFQPPADPSLDNKLQIDAKVCTQPAVDSFFPVKVLFVIDTSNSMSVTDRGALRAQAVTEVLQRFSGNPSVSLGVIAFDARVDVLTPGFTNNPDISAIATRLSSADRLTDYQGAIGAAYTMIATDMQRASPSERARTKYVVIFFSDGTPDPQCSATANEFPALAVCEVPRQEWESAFDPPLDPSLYPQLNAGGDYNQPAQVYQAVDDIVALQDFYRAGEVRLFTALLFDPVAAADPLAIPFRLDRAASSALLTGMAMRGGGTYTEFDSATKIDFLNINYTSIKQRNELAMFLAVNQNEAVSDRNTVGTEANPADVDTDGDGLPDAVERPAGLCAAQAAACADPTDSDGDGYSDLFEDQNRPAGFDPGDAAEPATPCTARGDSDGDGLKDCEELFLGTDTRLFDTDGDRVSDAFEARLGLDPSTVDAYDDADRDGVRNIDEVRAHTDPVSRASNLGDEGRYLYDVTAAAPTPDGTTCYDLTIRNVRLVTTGKGSGQPLGWNRIIVQFLEAPADRPLDFGELRLACVNPRYIDGDIKLPASGKVALTDANFVSASSFRASRDCVTVGAP